MSNQSKIAILGYGAEGKALKKYFGNKAVILDRKLDKDYLKNLKNFDIIFRSPGIPYLWPEIQQAKKSGVKISSATQLFFEQLRGLTQITRGLTRKNRDVITVGITGTKGKGTTATLLYKILGAAGKRVFLAGNIGEPMINLLPKILRKSASNHHESATAIAVLELSSFQLQDLTQSPKIAVVLDISPDHLNQHKNFQEYWQAKANIAKHQDKKDAVIFSRDNIWSKKIAKMSRGRKIGFVVNPEPFGVAQDKPRRRTTSLLTKIRSALKLPGEHNLKNAYAAALAATQLGVSEKIILKTIANFKGLLYRLQLVHKNPDIYNDSASTNPEATIAAIKAVKPTILIMGGVNKGLSYKDLPKTINYSPIRTIYLYGKSRWEISFALKKIKPQVKIFPDLKSVIKNIKAKKEDTILFSPGAASLDQFRKYQERGRMFNTYIVRHLRPL